MTLRLLFCTFALSACSTPCQQLCVRMADYATECGVNVSDAALQTCLDEQSQSDAQGACREAGDADTLRREWDCSDVQVFFE